MEPSSRSEISRQLVNVCHLLYHRGFVTASDGNVSARLSNGNLLVTPSALNKGRVTEADLVEVKADGTPVTLSRKASTELDMHLFIYGQRDDAGAVVHAHPTHATGFATARMPLNECLFPEVIVGLGAIPLAQYATPSTKEVSEALAPYVKKADAILLANHGVVTYGKDLDEAYFKMEKVEHAAHIAFVARMLGGEKPLTPGEIEKLRSISETSYGKDFSQKIACEPMQELEYTNEEELKDIIREILRK
ncbi:MAG: class II aldolase/adducin family protein [Ignavibacteriales bacterium]|nr:class II aldolase/adducin family protein [Ignavibacteriales bacterium]